MLSDATIVYTDGAARKLWLEKMCNNKIIMNIRLLGTRRSEKRGDSVYESQMFEKSCVCPAFSQDDEILRPQ